jgi:hypothetical protein
VRFLLDPTNNRTVSSMVFIGPTDNWSDGIIQLERVDDDSDDDATNGLDHDLNWYADSSGSLAFIVRGFDNNTSFPSPTGWVDLYRRRLLTNGARIRIPRDGGTWYTVQTDLLPYSDPLDPQYKGSSYPPRLRLTVAYRESPTNLDPTAVPAFNPGSGPQTYELELPPTVLPNQEPVLMPKGAVIHLDRCSTSVEQTASGPPATGRGNKLPSAWKVQGASNAISANTGFVYSTQMDVMFSPRGVVIGPAAQNGLIHFYICDQKDADRDRLEWESASGLTQSVPEYATRASDGLRRGDKVIATLFTRSRAPVRSRRTMFIRTSTRWRPTGSASLRQGRWPGNETTNTALEGSSRLGVAHQHVCGGQCPHYGQ